MRLPIFLLLLLPFLANAQDPQHGALPSKFDGMEQKLLVNHFPSPVMATTDPDEEEGSYFWKHTTTVLSPAETVELVEFGAYIYYNNQWNLRVSYPAKDFEKLFGGTKNKLKKGQPYTYPQNWRGDTNLRGGWAMWYFIAVNSSNDTVFGVGKLWTGEATYAATTEYQLDTEASTFLWKGWNGLKNYSLEGTLKASNGKVLCTKDKILSGHIEIDMTSMGSQEKSLVAHLMEADFFDVKNHKKAWLTLEAPISLTDTTHSWGQLTVRGFTAPVNFFVTPSRDGDTIEVHGNLTFDRTIYGSTYLSPDGMEGNKADGISNDVDLAFQVIFKR